MTGVGEPDGGITILDGSGRSVRSLHDEVPPSSEAKLPPAAFMALAFSRDGLMLAAGADNGKVVLWDHVNGRKLAVLRPPGGGAVATIAVSADGKTVAVGTTAGRVESWDLAAHALTRSISVTGGFPQALAFSPDGLRMAVGLSRRGTLIFPSGASEPTTRLTAVPGRDATFRVSLPSGRIESWGKESGRYLSCRAGRFVLPPEGCQTTTR